jgi:CSLREA domain-containing protein
MFVKSALRAALATTVFVAAMATPTFASAATPISIDAPATVAPEITTAVTLRLPDGVAAVEGRVLVDSSAAQLVGVAASSGGKSLAPTETAKGFAFGVYGMKASGTKNDVSLVLMPHVAGQLEIRVVVDAAANSAGQRVSLPNQTAASRLQVGHGSTLKPAPTSAAHGAPHFSAQAVRSLFGKVTISADDLDVARADWYGNRDASETCSTSTQEQGDANGDGCIDIVDLQLIAASQGTHATSTVAGRTVEFSGSGLASAASTNGSTGVSTSTVNSAAPGPMTFVVTSTADNADATPGDGLCADSTGQCTLRAAMTESNWHSGTNTIDFNLIGIAPVTIQLSSATLSLVGSSGSSMIIDGYSQPGSVPNTAQYGFNGVPGVFVKGANATNTKYIFYSARPGNTIRGIAMGNAYRGIFLDTPNASGNTIAGDWFGFNRDGTNGTHGHAGVYVNNGANHNFIGTPALADRNVSGNQEKGMYLYGSGTSFNTFNNNILCMRPNGGTSPCSTGIDMDFGPQSNVVGGTGPNELNFVGPTLLNGIELSHGWDPSTNHVSKPEWQINFNQVVGNWVGFRVDGSYDPNYVSAQYAPSADNGQALHMHNGSNYNVFDSNYVAAAYDGVTIAMNDCTGDVVRNNIIGVSPLGQPAPLRRYGIYFALNTQGHTVESNVIRNVSTAGIALIDFDVQRILLTKNIVSDTNGPAIYEAQDPNNPGTGANNLLAPPQISSANPASVNGTGIAGATVELFRASKPAGQSGLPIAYVGSAIVATDGTWAMATSLQQGDSVTATEAISNGNTSVLSSNLAVGAPPPPPVASFTALQEANTLTVDYSDTSSGAPKAWSWDFGDGTTSQEQNPSHTYTAAGDYTVSLTATNDGGSDTDTQTVTVTPLSQGTSVAADSFSRSDSGGWGDADTGGAYTLDGALLNFNVANGVGTMTLSKAGANRGATLTDVSATNIDASVRVAESKLPTGQSIIAYIAARQTASGANAYRPKLILNTNGTVSVGAGVVINGAETAIAPSVVVPGLTQSANAFIWLRTKITGTNPTVIQVKAWADGTAEPNGWQFSATNNATAVQVPGAVGLRAYANAGVTNAPITMSFDDFNVVVADVTPPPTGIAGDEFDRTLSGAWGSADNGGAYTLQGSASNYNVANGAGTITVPSKNTTRSALLNNVSATDVDIAFRVSVDQIAAVGPDYVYAVARRIGTSEYRPRLVLNPNGNITVSASRVVSGTESSLGAGVVTGLTQASGAYIWIRAQVVGTNPTTINVKAWADGSPEPSTWQFSATDSSAELQAAGSVGMRVYIASNSTAVPATFSFDDFAVVAPAP